MFKMCMNPPCSYRPTRLSSSEQWTTAPKNYILVCASINEADHLIGWLQLFVGVDGGRSWHFRPLSSYKHLFWVGFWGWEHTQIRIYSWMIYDLARYTMYIHSSPTEDLSQTFVSSNANNIFELSRSWRSSWAWFPNLLT